MERRTAMATKGFSMMAFWCAAVVMLGSPSDASAHHTYFTFSQAVQIPGNVTLPSGRYEFRIIQTTSTRRLIEVRDGNTEKLHATVFVVPAEHSGPSEKSQIRLTEARENEVPAVLFWWDGGGRRGYEFVYPREQALRLSRATRTSIAMSTLPMSTTAAELRSARVMRAEVGSEAVATTGTVPADVLGEVASHAERRR
jgi:hypothetical protein